METTTISRAYRDAADRLWGDYEAAFRDAPDFPSGLEAAVDRVLARFADDPELARLCCVDALSGDRELLALRARRRRRFVALLASEHARRADRGETVPVVQFEMLAGGLFRAVGALVAGDRLDEPRDALVAEVLTAVRALEPAGA